MSKPGGPDVTPFSLKSDTSFGCRAGNVFAGLGDLEAKHMASEKARSSSSQGKDDVQLIKDDPQEEAVISSHQHANRTGSPDYQRRHGQGGSGSRDDRPSTRGSCSSQFKMPHNPAPRNRGHRVPDHKVHPNSWTYYNMEDVSTESMSDRSNTSAALSIIANLEEESPRKKQKTEHSQREDEEEEPMNEVQDDPNCPVDDPSPHDNSEKIVFRKPKRTAVNDEKADQLLSKHGCIVQPEYFVGQKPASIKTKSKKQSKAQPTPPVCIGHIMEDEEDEDSLEALPTRTVFSGCDSSKEHSEPMDTEQNFVSFLGKDKKVKTRSVRAQRRSGDDDDDEDDVDESAAVGKDILSRLDSPEHMGESDGSDTLDGVD